MELEKRQQTLPEKIEDLAKFVIVNFARSKAAQEALKAAEKAKMPAEQLAKIKEAVRETAELQLFAECRLGEYFAKIPTMERKRTDRLPDNDVAQLPTKTRRIEDLGFNMKQAERFETLAAHPEIVERIIKEAKDDDDIPTRTEVLRKIAQKETQEKINEIKKRELQPAKGKYDVIIIDPPWPMIKIERDCAPEQVEFDYPTMTTDEIKQITLPKNNNCHLFLWSTHKFLPTAFEILSDWDFKYVCCFVWHKNGGFQPFNLPQYNNEFVLYARFGTPVFTETKDFPTCFSADRTGHSKKPDEFYDMIKRVTCGKRIDMFNRRKIEGFETWGNECQ